MMGTILHYCPCLWLNTKTLYAKDGPTDLELVSLQVSSQPLSNVGSEN